MTHNIKPKGSSPEPTGTWGGSAEDLLVELMAKSMSETRKEVHAESDRLKKKLNRLAASTGRPVNEVLTEATEITDRLAKIGRKDKTARLLFEAVLRNANKVTENSKKLWGGS